VSAGKIVNQYASLADTGRMRILSSGFNVGAEICPVRAPGSAHPQRFDLHVELTVSERDIGAKLDAAQVFRARFKRGRGTGSLRLQPANSYSVHGQTLQRYVGVIANVDPTSVLTQGIRIALTGKGADVALRGAEVAFPVRYGS
jgi:hypothetical protein